MLVFVYNNMCFPLPILADILSEWKSQITEDRLQQCSLMVGQFQPLLILGRHRSFTISATCCHSDLLPCALHSLSTGVRYPLARKTDTP